MLVSGHIMFVVIIDTMRCLSCFCQHTLPNGVFGKLPIVFFQVGDSGKVTWGG
jgi:hypothetical protein